MNSERQKILEMLENGQVSAQEAAQLLDCLTQEEPGEAPSENLEITKREQKKGGRGKKLRVDVHGDTPEVKKINVNVSLPLALARLAENIIENCLPNSAQDELKKQGIDLKALNIGELINTVESLEEDIVNADIDNEEIQLKVRVYVE